MGQHESKLVQVWAHDTTTGLDVRIRNGHADELRADCDSGRLICPMPDCKDPRIRPVVDHRRLGSPVRAHFRHVGSEVNHQAESWFHLTAKLLFARWLQRRKPDWYVDVERTLLIEPRRRPDVYARSPDGAEYAIEVQYSPITLEGWNARTTDVTAAGMHSIWIWGHLGCHFKVDRDDGTTLRLSPLLRTAWIEGHRPHWINPDAEELVSLAASSEDFWLWQEPAFVTSRLADADIVDGVLITDTDWAALEHARRMDERRAEMAATERRRAALEAERIAAQAEAERLRAERIARERELQRRLWENSELYGELVTKYGEVPTILSTPTSNEDRVRRHAVRWRAEVFMDAVQGHVGQDFEYRHFCRRLFLNGESSEDGYAALNGFLFALRSARYVAFRNRSYRIEGAIRVQGDLDRAPPEPKLKPPSLLRTGPIRVPRRPPPDLASLSKSQAAGFADRHPLFSEPISATIRSRIASLPDGASVTLSELLASVYLKDDAMTREVVIDFLRALRTMGSVIATDHDLYSDGPITRPPR